MFEYQDEDNDEFETLYEDGHWEWSDITNELIFISHIVKTEEDLELPPPTILGSVEFRNDIDLIEQQRFRKRFQRKVCDDKDIIFLQDVLDVVLFTAPTYILSASVINVLHLKTTERFIRALILYCQYYLQTADEMTKRILELDTKVRTPKTMEVELEYRENLEDLRLLVAKEYSTMIVGGADFKKFHHMGPDKKMQSLSRKDRILFESVLLIIIQIVWLALGRIALNQIELEVHRLFKSQIFNVMEHKLHTNFESKMAPQERFVLMGHVKYQKKLNTLSPLMNTLHCPRPIDFRLLGCGTIKFANLTYRQQYFEEILTANEESFGKKKLTLGILGMPRSQFDTMLKEIRRPVSTSSSSASVRARTSSKQSRSSIRKNTTTTSGISHKLYPDVILPEKTCDKEWLPDAFPMEFFPEKKVNKVQRRKWLAKAIRHTPKKIIKS